MHTSLEASGGYVMTYHASVEASFEYLTTYHSKIKASFDYVMTYHTSAARFPGGRRRMHHSVTLHGFIKNEFARPMRALCAPNEEANHKAQLHASNEQTKLVSRVIDKHKCER